MKYTLILLIILLFIWLSYFVIKKLGFFDWFRATWFYQTTFYKCISFPLKVYIFPLRMRTPTKDEIDKKKVNISCMLLAMGYFSCVSLGLIGTYFTTEQYRMIQQIKTNNYGTLSGKIVGLNRTSKGSKYSMVIELEDGYSQVVQYSNPDEINSDFKGKYILINYVVRISGAKVMVSAVLENKKIGSMDANLKWRLEWYASSLKWDKRFLFFAFILPWIRYWRCGLARFYERSK